MAKFGIGQSIRRVEDPRLLTGGGRYTDDTKLAAPAARAYVLRSPHAHADIRKIDTTAARKAPGVLLVFTGEDVKKADFGDVPCLVPLENRDGSPARRDPAADAGPGPRPPCRRSGGAGGGRDAGAGQGRRRADRGRLRGASACRRHLRGGPARRAAGARSHQGQHRLRLGDGRPAPRPRRPSPRPTRWSSCRSSTSGWS